MYRRPQAFAHIEYMLRGLLECCRWQQRISRRLAGEREAASDLLLQISSKLDNRPLLLQQRHLQNLLLLALPLHLTKLAVRLLVLSHHGRPRIGQKMLPAPVQG